MKSSFALAQCFLDLSPFCSLPQQRKNENRLCHAQQNDANDVLLIGLPKSGLPIDLDTSGRKVAFSEPPALQCSPIEHVDVSVFHDGYFLRLFPSENSNGDSTGNPTFVTIRSYKAAYRPLANKRILHNKNRCIGGTDDQRKRLSFVNEVRSGSILRDRRIKDDRMFGESIQSFEKRRHFQVVQIGELVSGFVTVQLL